MNGAAKANGMSPGPGNPGRLDNMRDPLPCWSVWQAHIDRHGRLVACCFGDTPDNAHVMADLTQMPFHAGWNSDKFQSLRAAHLARIAVDNAEAEAALTQLTRVFGLIEDMQAVDVSGIEPMAHAQDLMLRLRDDVVTEGDQRNLFQSVAPEVEAGLYLVPKVIE
jgi:aspartyl-tRNA(Asn)/glutamyl-tRNA(Gln) amidotransferase subunit C